MEAGCESWGQTAPQPTLGLQHPAVLPRYPESPFLITVALSWSFWACLIHIYGRSSTAPCSREFQQ